MHIRVYYKYCPSTVHNLAEYERTNAGAASSPAATTGRCVANSIQVNHQIESYIWAFRQKINQFKFAHDRFTLYSCTFLRTDFVLGA